MLGSFLQILCKNNLIAEAAAASVGGSRYSDRRRSNLAIGSQLGGMGVQFGGTRTHIFDSRNVGEHSFN